MAVLVKICGLRRQEDAVAVLRAGADYAGLVFHRGSPRHLRVEQAAALAALMRGRIRLVALLTDPADDALAEMVKAVEPDFLQLHGKETPERVAEIRARFHKPVIKAIGVAQEADLAPLAAYEAVADMLLFDAKPAAHAAYPGGQGRAFDWQLLRRRKFCRPWLLAGGLDAQNVARAIRASGATGVDVSSGVETAPGVKDAQAVVAFVAAARASEFAMEQSA